MDTVNPPDSLHLEFDQLVETAAVLMPPKARDSVVQAHEDFKLAVQGARLLLCDALAEHPIDISPTDAVRSEIKLLQGGWLRHRRAQRLLSDVKLDIRLRQEQSE